MPFRCTALAKGINVCINNKNSSSAKLLTFQRVDLTSRVLFLFRAKKVMLLPCHTPFNIFITFETVLKF